MVDWDDEPLMWDDPMGLVFVGGDLEPDSILGAYRRGIFPWFNEDDPFLWWSPDPRSIFPLDAMHFSRRLLRVVRQGKFHVTFDHAFAEVMRHCGMRPEGTWVTLSMKKAYLELHRLGHAHSVEAWYGGRLAGGVYGVALGGFFAAESMFHLESNAGMVALFALAQRLRQQGFTLFDTQLATDHTRGIGAVDIPRVQYLLRLEHALHVSARFDSGSR